MTTETTDRGLDFVALYEKLMSKKCLVAPDPRVKLFWLLTYDECMEVTRMSACNINAATWVGMDTGGPMMLLGIPVYRTTDLPANGREEFWLVRELCDDN